MGLWERDCDYGWKTWAVIAAVVAVLVVALTFIILAFAVFKPPTAMADDALLTTFNLSASPNASTPSLQLLSYNVTVLISLRNPNIYRSISYSAIATAFSFNGTKFDDGTVQPFETGAKKTTTLRVTVGGVDKALPKLSTAGPAEFGKEKEAGQFQVEAKLDGVMEYKGKSKKCPVAVVCQLKLQLVDPDVAATAFQRTKCIILRAKTSGC